MDYASAYRQIEGLFPAIPTALTPEEELDVPAQRRLVEYMLAGGAHGLWVLGTGGEAAALTDAVRNATLDVTLDAVAGRVPVIAGVGDAGTRRTIQRIQALEGKGVTALALIAPYFFFHTDRDLLLHVEALLAATDLPIMLYNNPFNAHNTFTLNVVRTLAANPQVVGIKDSSGNFSYFMDLLAYCQSPTFRVFTGTESQLATSVLLGGEGAVMAMPLLAPQLVSDIYAAARAGDQPRALALQTEMNELALLLAEGPQLSDAEFLGAVKYVLSLHGVCGPTLASPLAPITAAHAQRIRTTLEARGLLSAAPSAAVAK